MQTLVQLPCRESYHFPTDASMKHAGELKVGTQRPEEGNKVEKPGEGCTLRPPGPFLKGGGELGLWGRKCCALYCWSWASPFRTGGIHRTAGRTQNFHLHPSPTGMSQSPKHSVQPAYLTAKVAKGNWNILRKSNFHQDMSSPSPRVWGLLRFRLCCFHLHHTSLFC